MSFTTVTVTGKYVTPAGAPAVGTVSFTLSAPIMDAAGKVIRTPATTVATLDGTGAFSVALPANDDAGTTPTGTTYEVVEQLSLSGPRAYAVVIPHTAAAGTVDITALAPVSNTSVVYGVTSLNGRTGAVALTHTDISDFDTEVRAVGSAAYAAKKSLSPARGATRIPYTGYAFPTVTVSASNATTTLGAGNYDVPAASWDANATLDTTHYVYSDAPAQGNTFVPSGLGVYRNTAYSKYSYPGVIDGSLTVHIGYVGQTIELLMPATGFKYRIFVDGVVDPSGWRTIAGDGTQYRVKLAFAEVADRTITVQLPAGQFSGATIGRDEAIYRAELPKLPLCIIQSDSIGAGQSNDGTKLEIFSVFVGQQMGWTVWTEAQGGTGFKNPGSSTGFSNAVSRLSTNVIPYAPDIVGACFGLNDTSIAGYTAADTDTQIRAWAAALRAALPNAYLFVVGLFFTCDLATNSAKFAPQKVIYDQQKATCAALGIDFVDSLGWQTGDYGVSGTANALLFSDGIHPLLRGHRYYATRIVRGLTTLLSKSGIF